MQIKERDRIIGNLKEDLRVAEEVREKTVLDYENKLTHLKTDHEQQTKWLREQKEKHLEEVKQHMEKIAAKDEEMAEQQRQMDKLTDMNEGQVETFNNLNNIIKNKMNQIRELQN